MRKTRKMVYKTAAASMAALMAVSVMPTSFPYLGYNKVIEAMAAEEAEAGIDLTQGLKAGQVYGGSLNMSVLTDLGYMAKPQEIESVSYPGYVYDEANTNAKADANGIPTSQAMVLKPEKGGELTVSLKVNKGKKFVLLDESGAELDVADNSTGTASAYFTKTFELEAGKTYYMYAPKNKLFVYNMVWEETQAAAETSTVDLSAGLKADTNYSGFSTFEDWAIDVDKTTGEAKSQEVDGETYSPYVNAKSNPTLNGNIPTGGGALKFTAEADGSIDLVFKISKSKTYKFVAEDGTVIDEIQNTGAASMYKSANYEVKAGKTYYAYVGGSKIGLYKASVTKGSATQVAWEQVETPEITSVDVNEDGAFEVSFNANIDKRKGAEYVRISMLEDGKEVSTQTVASSKVKKVTFTPLWSGNYTFKAVAVRPGEANKESAVVEKSGYVMAVRKPVITWAQNVGNGSVYVDWVNISDADSYAIGYRKAGSDADYTMVETSLPATQGDYTLTGLVAGEKYEIVVKANRAADNFTSVATKEVTVKAAASQQWYVATIGSAQETNATITDADGKEQKFALSSKDSTENKQNLAEAVAIANTTGTLTVDKSDAGKISDDEDGFSYYFTKVNPDTENFKISADFEVVDGTAADNQTGFGLVAADTVGINNWGQPDYVHKYFNYASSMMFSHKQSNPVMRSVKGYTSADASSNDGVERSVDNSKKFTQTKANFEAGSKYTFTLEKTDAGYVATCNGEELKLDDNSFTSVQEDGTIAVGVMVARKVTVNVSNVKFEKSESKGITAAADSNAKITPSGRVYSTNTCAASEYEYIYVPNCAGTLVVTDTNGKEVAKREVKGNEVVRVNVPISVGKNTVKSVFTPAASEEITSTTPVETSTDVTCVRYGVEGQTIIVSADGTAEGKGTEESPLDITTAVKYAQPGQTIFLKDGVYKSGATIARSVSGTKDKPITLVAENRSTDGKSGVVFEGAGITVVGSYWHIYGLYVKDAGGVGIQISGNYNTIEMCTVNHSANSGVQISRNGGADNEAGRVGKLWPTGNLIKNCESFDNCDSGRNDADGFAAKLTCGEDNKFFGCISHHNIDDGWDLYAKSVSGEIGAVTIENCVTYNNGWLSFENPEEVGYGEGNGFKLGGGYLKGGHTLINSVSFDNHAKGITSNSCPDCKIINSTSYNNSLNNNVYNVGLNTKESNVKAWEVKGLLSINNKDNTKQEDLIPFSLLDENNYFYNGANSYNAKGVEATDDWFVSKTFVAPTRNEDGTIDLHGYAVLNDKAPANTGAKLDVTSADAKSVKPEKTEVVSDVTKPTETPTEVPTEKPAETPTEAPTQKPTETQTEDTKPVVTEPTKNDTDEEGTVTFANIEVTGDMPAAAISSDAVLVKADGSAAKGETKLVVETPKEAAFEQKVDEAFTKSNITFAPNVQKMFFDVKMVDADNSELDLAKGSIRLVFAYPADIDVEKFDFNVYHIKDDGTAEKLAAALSPNGIIVETTGLSPFVVTYEEKAETAKVEEQKNPQTGDAAPIAVLFATMAAGAAGIYEALRKKVRR